MDKVFTAAAIGTFLAFALLDVLRPTRRFPTLRGWRAQGVGFFAIYLVMGTALPLFWDEWLGRYRLIDATGLGTVGGGVVGLLVLQLGVYAWHRTMHRFAPLWRIFHQMHHSAERVDIFGAFYFHPLDNAAFALVGSLCLVILCGVTAEAAMLANGGSLFCAMFQHANLRTPAWLGYIVQRPENHALHHERGTHACNYGDIPFWDMLFGTYRNVPHWEGDAGFYPGASRRILAMLVGRDVSVAPAPAEAVTADRPRRRAA